MLDSTRKEGDPLSEQPTPPAGAGAGDRLDASALASLLADLERVRADLVHLEGASEPELRNLHDAYQKSGRNLVHYLALRRHDLRALQMQLARLGLSSLGRTESHVLAGLDAVIDILSRLAGRPAGTGGGQNAPVDIAEGAELLRTHTEAVLGPRRATRSVRIMVTMPSEAARNYELVKQLVAGGMDCMRINCAHDTPEAWAGMVANLQRAKQEVGTVCRILMDLAGPTLRTGPIDTETQVLKWSPQRDLYGRVTAPAHVWLTSTTDREEPPLPVDGTLYLSRDMLAQARSGDRLRFTDLRSKSRTLTLENALGYSRWATATQTAYLRAGGVSQVRLLPHSSRRTRASGAAEIGVPSVSKQLITVQPDETLIVTRAPLPGKPATYDNNGQLVRPATISCTLPAIFADVKPGERIWFDDGKIGGVIESVEPEAIRVRITAAKAAGARLGSDKGINLPDSHLRPPSLTDKDVADLAFVAAHADLVGLSFVRRPADVRLLQQHLTRLHAEHLALVLKIETQTGFEQLPHLLLAAMRGNPVGVMIASGALAVECSYERLAEVQEEIRWVCEAAHVPVIWATQALENLAKKGMPSRAAITDAAMGEGAECVVVNQGPHLVDALRSLDDILRRMEAHPSKQSAHLRPLPLSALTSL